MLEGVAVMAAFGVEVLIGASVAVVAGFVVPGTFIAVSVAALEGVLVVSFVGVLVSMFAFSELVLAVLDMVLIDLVLFLRELDRDLVDGSCLCFPPWRAQRVAVVVTRMGKRRSICVLTNRICLGGSVKETFGLHGSGGKAEMWGADRRVPSFMEHHRRSRLGVDLPWLGVPFSATKNVCNARWHPWVVALGKGPSKRCDRILRYISLRAPPAPVCSLALTLGELVPGQKLEFRFRSLHILLRFRTGI